MAMLNNQRVYPVYDRFKRNNDDTPMSLKLEPSSSEINAVHDSKNIAWLAGKKNRKWCANVFSPRSKPAAQDRLHPHRPCIQTAGIYLPFRGDDHGLSHSNLHLYWTNCHHYRMFFFQGAQPVMFLGLLISLIMNISISTIKPTDIGMNSGSQVLFVCKPL